MGKLIIIGLVSVLLFAIVAAQTETKRCGGGGGFMQEGGRCPREFAGRWVESDGRRCFCERVRRRRLQWTNCSDTGTTTETPETTTEALTTEATTTTAAPVKSAVIGGVKPAYHLL